MMKKSAALLLLMIALLPLGASAESDRWYEVEVIVFLHNSAATQDGEVWPRLPGEPDTSNARNLGAPMGRDGKARPFQRLTENEMRMNEDYERLRRSAQYRPLLHTGWRQPGYPANRAVEVHLNAGSVEVAEAQSQAASFGDQGNSPAVVSREKPRLDGTIKVVLSRYLHVTTDLIYRDDPAPLPAAAPGADTAVAAPLPRQGITYRLQQERRMRSSEIHYIDHPRFGVVVLITPYEAAKIGTTE